MQGITRRWRWVALGVLALLLAFGLGAYYRSLAAGEGGLVAGEGAGGDAPTTTYTDPGGAFSLTYPRGWGPATQPGEAIRLTGHDEFISVQLVASAPSPLDYAKGDAVALTANPGYRGTPPKAYTVAGQNGAMVAYTWQAPWPRGHAGV